MLPVSSWRVACALALALSLGGVGCGKRGNPQAPIRPVPGPVTQLSARRVGDTVEIHFNVPLDNSDQSTPPVVAKVNIYGAPGPPVFAPLTPASVPIAPFAIPVNDVPVVITTSVPLVISRFTPVTLSEPSGYVKAVRSTKAQTAPTTAAALTAKKYLRGTVEVRPAPPPTTEPGADVAPAGSEPPSAEVPPTPEDPRPLPGWTTTVTERVSAERTRGQQGTELSIMRYEVVGVSKSNRPGALSALIEIPLGTELPSPRAPRVSYDATTMTVTWTPGAPAQLFRVYKTDASGKEETVPLNTAPLPAPSFTLPVSPPPPAVPPTTPPVKAEFDQESCFAIRAVLIRGSASIESEPTPPICITPVDTFPPQAPTGLSALPTQSQIQLLWTAVTAQDLAGYVVMRAEAGSEPKALNQEPITDASFTDSTVRVGVRYSYVVVAVDKAGNRSLPSNQVDEIH